MRFGSAVRGIELDTMTDNESILPPEEPVRFEDAEGNEVCPACATTTDSSCRNEWHDDRE